jgi:S-DNA-T family DNA segregation ATPase FtsK/SpoIIIE
VTDIVEAAPQDAPAPRPVARPILPSWLTVVDGIRWGVGYYTRVFLFHALRVLPVYWPRVLLRSPAGIGRIARLLGRWAMDAPGTTMRTSIAHNTGKDAADGKVFVDLTKQHRQTVSGRFFVIVLTLAGIGVAGYTLLRDPWPIVGVSLVALTLLGFVGRSIDHPILSSFGDSTDEPKVTQELVLKALDSLGIAKLKATDVDIRWSGRDGPGWRADIDLPSGVTAAAVCERRDVLASGLRRSVSCVWPEGDSEVHEARLVLWVADKPMSKTKPIPWPYLRAGTINLFEPFQIGTDPRGRPIKITLMFASMVIGAIPRMGKTFFLRMLLLAAALDPRAELHIYDLKGGGDFRPLEPVAHRYRNGDDDDDIDYLLTDLRDLVAERRRRARTLSEQPADTCPESKVTPELSAKRDLGLHPIVLAIDECQAAFTHDEHKVEIEKLVTDLAKRGPAAGIIVINATQKPTDKSLPSDISSAAVLRFCLKVMGHIPNDVILGSGAYKSGIAATMFSRSDLGIGYLAGEGDDPAIVRTHYVDGPTAEDIVKRARAARLAAGTLTGHAVGEEGEPEEDDDTILDELVGVWPVGRTGVWLDELAERLEVRYPTRHEGCTKDYVREALAPFGIRTKKINLKDPVDGKWKPLAGITWEALQEALRGRQGTREDRSEPQDAA